MAGKAGLRRMFRRRQKGARSPGDPSPGDASRVNAFRSPEGEKYTVVVREGSSLAVAYSAYEHYRQHDDVASLRRAVAASTEAIGSTSDDPLVLAQVHALRCMVLGQAYRIGGQRELLDQAVVSGRQALSLRGPSDPYYPETVASLAEVLAIWWEREQDPVRARSRACAAGSNSGHRSRGGCGTPGTRRGSPGPRRGSWSRWTGSRCGRGRGQW